MEIPQKCRAAVLSEYGRPLAIQDVPVPQQIEDNAILTRVRLAGICGTDVHQTDGRLGLQKPLPQIPGHETLAEIIRLGHGRTHDVAGQKLSVGDRILWSHVSCGDCYFCAVRKTPYLCSDINGYGMAPVAALRGGFAEYEYVIPETQVVKVPEDISDEEAVGVGCAFRSVVNAFERLSRYSSIGFQEDVVIQGAGPIGLYAAIVAANSNAGRVIVIGAPEKRLALAEKWGATHIINIDEYGSSKARQEIVMEITQGRGARIVMECSGVPQAFNEGFGLLQKGGTYLIVGQTSPVAVEFMPFNFLLKNAVVIGSGGADITHFYKALKFVKNNRGRYPMDALVSGTYPLEEINLALENMRAGSEIKPVIDMR